MSRTGKSKRKPGLPVTWKTFKALGMSFPGVEEGKSWGTPAIKVRGKMLARLREDGETVVIRIEIAARALMIEADPEAFFYTDHYANYPAVLIRLASVQVDDLKELIEDAWRELAPKKIVAAHDATREA